MKGANPWVRKLAAAAVSVSSVWIMPAPMGSFSGVSIEPYMCGMARLTEPVPSYDLPAMW